MAFTLFIGGLKTISYYPLIRFKLFLTILSTIIISIRAIDGKLVSLLIR